MPFSLLGISVFLVGLSVVLKFYPQNILTQKNVMFKVPMAHISGKDKITEESIRKLVGRQYCKTNCEILP